MAKGTADWTKDVNLRTAATLASSGTATEDLNLDTDGAIRVEAQIDIAIGLSTGVKVEVFGSVDDGAKDDTKQLDGFETTVSEVRTLILTGAHRQIKLTNLDASNPTGLISIKYAWLRWDVT